jgi:hypothetical protein
MLALNFMRYGARKAATRGISRLLPDFQWIITDYCQYLQLWKENKKRTLAVAG